MVFVKAVVAAAEQVEAPVLIGASEGERRFFGTPEVAAVVRSLRERGERPIFLNADHTHSLESAVEAAKAGFDAVVIDFSKLPFDENVRRTREVVEAVRAIDGDIIVEGEIGDIGSGSRIHEGAGNEPRHLTTADEARRFVDATGIDVLAPAVGNRHGMVAGMVRGETKKRLDVGRIAEIKEATGVFLTLHGASGTDDEDLRRAIVAGINIVHINTEMRVAWRNALEASLARAPGEVVPYDILSPVVAAVQQIVQSRLRLFGARPPIGTAAAAGDAASDRAPAG
jgi:fructose-bisphosphate aldolase class II